MERIETPKMTNMKTHFPQYFLLAILSLFSGQKAVAQWKSSGEFNKLLHIEGTDIVVATYDEIKKFSWASTNVLFINTSTGESRELELSKTADIRKVNTSNKGKINGGPMVVIEAQTLDLNGNGKVDFFEPLSLFVCDAKGENLKRLTPDNFFVKTWEVVPENNRMVISGKVDSNQNGKKDEADEASILIVDLNTMEVVKEL